MTSMPAQHAAGARQDYCTPTDLLGAVETTFGEITHDLACDADNRVASSCYTVEDDALAQDWTTLKGVLWCNPPFRRIGPWAQKCAESSGPERLILLLTPASVGSRWFADHVHEHALVLALTPRITFVGALAPYPKDCILSVYGAGVGFDVWRWR